MPRRPRFDFPGTIHHISIRGVEKRAIFLDDDDHADLLCRFERWLVELGAECFAWSLIFNHVHLVIRRSDHSLAELMARFSSAFAQNFNRRYGRVGHLFQGRYKSRLIEHDDDLRWMLAYTLGNPVRHGITSVAALGRYRWCGYASAMGMSPVRAFESCKQALLAFDEDESRARNALREMIESAAENQWVRADARFEAVVDGACERFSLPRSQLHTGSRAAGRARAEVVARSVEELAMPWTEVAMRLGVSRAAVHRAIGRNRDEAQSNEARPKGVRPPAVSRAGDRAGA